ncbi:MAG: T9SS type B sorting domain-containing protein [Bacteroidota bacterium]
MSRFFLKAIAAGLFFTIALHTSVYAQCPITVNAGEDIYLCAPAPPTQLDGQIDGDYLSFAWSPTTGMTGANTLNPTVTISQTTTYVLTAKAANLNNNLINNGDFEGGNSGFSSDYLYNPGDLVPEGLYDILPNPQADHPGFAPCPDHSGGGNMMAVNGAGTPNQDVWCQTITVIPNTAYVFSAWVATLVASSPARLQFSINGSTIGPIFNAPGQTCVWQNFFATWNSGANSSATICIVNQNTVLGGNDFAIDDLLFAPVCTVTDTVKVNVISITATASPSIVTIPCDGAPVTLSGNGSSTGTNITYNWSTTNGNIVSGANTLTPVVNAAGEYVLTVTFEKNGYVCEKTASVNVVENANPFSAWITPPSPLGCGSSSTVLIGNTTQPGFSTYQWTTTGGNIVSGSNSKICTVNQPGTYDLLATNTATGCTATASVNVTVANNPPNAVANASGLITCVQNTVNLSGSGSSTGPGINYAWTTPNGSFTSGQNTINAIAGSAGIYIIGVTNTTNNCTTYDTVLVSSNKVVPQIAIQAPGVLDCDTDTLSISSTINPANANLNWTYSAGGNIASGQGTNTPKITSAATYTLTATNPANGCTSTSAVTVTADHQHPTAVVLPADSITCQSPSVMLSGNGSSTGALFQYNWTAGTGGNIVSGGNTLTPLVNSASTYTLLVVNILNACTSTAAVTVVSDTNVVVAIANAPDTLNCKTGMVTLNANGSTAGASITYAWTTTTGSFAGGQNTANPTATLPGTYQLLLTNTANGCSATDLAIVNQDTLHPKLQIDSTGLLTCANPIQTIQAHNLSLPGHFSYHWTPTLGGNILSGDSTLAPVVNAPGSFTLTALNLVTGCSSSIVTSVQQEAGVPVINTAIPAIITCTTPTVVLNTNGSSSGANFVYQWTAANGGHIASGGQTGAPVVDQPGSYALIITNSSNGCTSSASVLVQRDTVSPKFAFTPPAVLTCYLPAENLQVQNLSLPGSFSYQWNVASAGNIVSGGTTLSPLVSAGGLYRLVATNQQNGCTSTLFVAVDSNISTPALLTNQPNLLTCANQTMSLPVVNQSLPGNFSYSWTSAAGGNMLSGNTTLNPLVNAAGTYVITATNLDNGCSNTATVTVSIDTVPPMVQIAVPPMITCANPSSTLQTQNLSLPGTFTYAWTATNGGTILSPSNILSPLIGTGGNYNLLVTNTINGCTSTKSVAATQNTQTPMVNAGMDDTLSCAVNSKLLSSTASGNGPLQYAWTASGGGNILTGNNTPTPSVNAAGNYALVVTNTSNGCTNTDNVQIFNDVNKPLANAGTAPKLTCTVQQITLNGTGSTGSGISYQWTTNGTGNIVSGANSLSPNINAPGNYVLAVTNSANGCTTNSAIMILQDTIKPIVDAGIPATLSCSVQSVVLEGTATAANGGNLSYLWSGTGIISGGTTLKPTINLNGSFIIKVTNSLNGCTATDQVQVGIDTIHPLIAVTAPQILTCAQKNVPVDGIVSQPGTGFTSTWTSTNGHFVSGQNTLSPMVDKPGIYQLTVKNTQNGCITTDTASVSQNIVPPIALTGAVHPLTCDSISVTLSGAGSSTGNLFSYNWAASNGGSIQSGSTSLYPIINAAGAYTLTVTNTVNGCSTTATATAITNKTAPSISIGVPPTLTCAILSAPIQGIVTQPASNFTTNWTPSSGGHIVLGQTTLVPTVDKPGMYTLLVKNLQNGCTASQTVTVGENIITPNADAGPTVELNCLQEQINLTGSSTTGGNLGYLWTTTDGHILSGNTSASPLVNAPGTYHLQITDLSNGCTATDGTSAFEVPAPSFIPSAVQPDCLAPKGNINFGTVTGGESPFTFSVDNGHSYQTTPTFNNLAPGNYTLIVLDANGCTDSKEVELKEPVYPTVTLGNVGLLDLGDSIQLEPTVNLPISSITQWLWTPGESLSCHDCEKPYAKPLINTLYNLVIKDQKGCTATADIQLRVHKTRRIYAPNIFSPDGDGHNDRFTLYGKGVKEVHNFRIYDRWGSQLFEVPKLTINNESEGWDGLYRGSPVNPAVFVWEAEVEFLDGETELLKGDVTLMR